MSQKYIDKIGRDCQFDPKKDFQRVESGLSISLTESLKTGVVKESSGTLDTNGIDDPEAVLGRVRDRFDAIESERAIRKYGRKADITSQTTAIEAPKLSE